MEFYLLLVYKLNIYKGLCEDKSLPHKVTTMRTFEQKEVSLNEGRKEIIQIQMIQPLQQ